MAVRIEKPCEAVLEVRMAEVLLPKQRSRLFELQCRQSLDHFPFTQDERREGQTGGKARVVLDNLYRYASRQPRCLESQGFHVEMIVVRAPHVVHGSRQDALHVLLVQVERSFLLDRRDLRQEDQAVRRYSGNHPIGELDPLAGVRSYVRPRDEPVGWIIARVRGALTRLRGQQTVEQEEVI